MAHDWRILFRCDNIIVCKSIHGSIKGWVAADALCSYRIGKQDADGSYASAGWTLFFRLWSRLMLTAISLRTPTIAEFEAR